VQHSLRIVHEDREVTRLGTSVFESGLVSPEAMAATLAALKRFYRAVQQHGANQVRAVATAAMRDARNGRAFLAWVRDETGWDVEINSGLEEAQVAPAAGGALLAEALHTWQQLRGTAGVAFALAGLGEVAAGRGQPHRAGQLLGAGQALLPAAHPLLHVVVPYDLSGKLPAARAAGDPAAFDRGVAEGQAWTIDQAVAAGLASVATPDSGLE